MNKCLCSSFQFGSFGEDGSAESWTDYSTGCKQSTTRQFAQGHDAKLVGFLVRAELGGEDIRHDSVTFNGAVGAARTISEALAVKTQAQLDAAKARLAKKAEVAARKAANRSAKKAERVAPETEAPAGPTTRHATIKIGRWTYRAAIMVDGGTAHYTTKLGTDKTAKLGEYTEI